jgi:hypothetical protein
MYRVGFGDCFLVSFPTHGGPRHVLVDCGVHSRGDIKTMPSVVRNVEQECGGKLAIVIATHEHQDHISGFASCSDIFSRIEAGEVWLPWPLDPDDPDAAKLRRARLQIAQELWSSLAAAPDSASKDVVLNMVGNQHALEVLRGGFAKSLQPRYLAAGEQLTAPGGISGLTVKIVGPPRDVEFLAKMEPPAKNHYLADVTSEAEAGLGNIFQARWRLTPEQFRLRAIIDFSSAEEQQIRKRAQGAVGPLAAALDHIVNNTSLVALMSFRGQQLLFPGDAQWGNWYWSEQKEDLLKLLGGITFYKVAHHGSFNATPKDALEAMPEGKFVAMVSTQNKPWPSIPRMPLIEELQRRTGQKLVRSDAIDVKDATPAAIPSGRLPPDFTVGDFWVDYTIRV